MSAEAANSKDYSLPPALDLKLDKSVFERKEVVLAVGLPLGRDFKKVWDQLRDFSTGYLDLPKFTNIYTDGNGVKRKLVFIRKAKDTKEQDMLRSLNVDIPASPEDEISYLESHPEAICVENCQPGESTTDSILPSKPCAFRLSLGYENFPFDRALKVVLPGDMEAVTGFSLVGHVAHFNLKPAALPYRRLIGKTEKKLCDFICFNATGQIALDKLANVRTVVNKAAKIDTDFRTFSLDLMAGEPDYLTEVKENNVTLKLDFSQVYWNSRLGTEHSRIIDEVKTVLGGHRRESELATVVVYDVFAGVGPFAVPLARCPGCRVFANDLNPMAFKFLQENVRKNSSRRHPISPEQITCSNLDGREFIHEVLLPHYQKFLQSSEAMPADFYMLMNLPALAPDFLDAFRDFVVDVVSDGPPPPIRTRCYCFVRHTLETDKSRAGKLSEADGESRERVCKALAVPPEALSTADTPGVTSGPHLTGWKVRFVRNTAPSRDMYCLEFDLHLPTRKSSKRPRVE